MKSQKDERSLINFFDRAFLLIHPLRFVVKVSFLKLRLHNKHPCFVSDVGFLLELRCEFIGKRSFIQNKYKAFDNLYLALRKTVSMTFRDLSLKKPLWTALDDLGYHTPQDTQPALDQRQLQDLRGMGNSLDHQGFLCKTKPAAQ
jgi:hypothetical protein